MAHLRPQIALPTHEVRNQPPAFEDVNLWTSDVALREAVLREGGSAFADHFEAFGGRTGSAEVIRWGF
ncbi:MAG: DNA alkylation response protein, partial [Myxococcales bacterium]|nr:DNA alkylation response protein [Myxococcales bacterium]